MCARRIIEYYEAIAIDGKLDMAWHMLQNVLHSDDEPDVKVHPEARSAFVTELQAVLKLALDTLEKASTRWYRNKDSERSEYLNRHGLGLMRDDSEPDCAPPWKYLPAFHQVLDGAMRLTQMYVTTLKMTKWEDAYERAGNHGRAEIVSLPKDVPPIGSNEVRKVCLKDHGKPQPVAAESLDAVKRSVEDMRRTMEEQLRSVTEKMDALSTKSTEAVESPIAHDVGVIKTTIERMAEEHEKHWKAPPLGKVHNYHRVVHHPFTGRPLQCERNVNAFNKIEEGRSVFLPIARDSLILGERFMGEIMQGLQSSLDFDLEAKMPQSSLKEK